MISRCPFEMEELVQLLRKVGKAGSGIQGKESDDRLLGRLTPMPISLMGEAVVELG